MIGGNTVKMYNADHNPRLRKNLILDLKESLHKQVLLSLSK